MTRILAAILLLTGCASSADHCAWDAEPLEELASSEAICDAWAERFGPLSAFCRRVPPVYAVEAMAGEYCPRTAAGCFVVRSTDLCRAVILRDGYTMDVRLYVHELTHWLAWCVDGHGDGQHSRPELWGADGFVQGTALGVM